MRKKININITKKNNKSLVVLIGIVVLLIVIIYSYNRVFYSKNKESDDKKEINISEKLIEDKEYENLILSDINIDSNSSIIQLTANVYNKSLEKSTLSMVKLVFFDKDNKKIGSLDAYLDDIKPKDNIRISVIIDEKFRDAYTFKITK